MSTRFKELVISGSFGLVKGFLLGYRSGRGTDFRYFFHRKSGIRRDTLGELVKEVFDMENLVHVCIEESEAGGFKNAVTQNSAAVGMEVKKEREIKGARFDFSFSVSDRDFAARLKQALLDLPPGVAIEGYHPEEKENKSVRAYGTLADYTFVGQGTIAGEFDGVMDFFLRIKRTPEGQKVLISDMALEFED